MHTTIFVGRNSRARACARGGGAHGGIFFFATRNEGTGAGLAWRGIDSFL